MEENNESWLRQINENLGGFNELVGLRTQAVGQGWCRMTCPIRPELSNPKANVHGGMIATAMDTAAGVAAIFVSGKPRSIVTQSASAHYLRPLKGSVLTVEARVVRAGRRTCLARSQVFDEEGRLCSVGDIELFYTD